MRLFYSYSSDDEGLRGELEDHLALLKRDGLLQTWSFRNIDAGSEWEREIDQRLAEANIVLILVSASFIASRYCWEIELRRAIERADRGELLLVPVIIRSCDWQTAPFARFQALPDGAKPVTSWRPRDRAWANVAAGIRHLMLSGETSSNPTTTSPGAASGTTQLVQTVHEIREATDQAERRRKRAWRQRREARMNLLSELPRLQQAMAMLGAHMAAAIPKMPLKVVSDGEQSTIATDRARMIIEPSETGHSLTVKLSHYGYALPTYVGNIFITVALVAWSFKKKWCPDGEQTWVRELSDQDEWLWRNHPDKLSANTDEFASLLLKRLAERHAGDMSPETSGS